MYIYILMHISTYHKYVPISISVPMSLSTSTVHLLYIFDFEIYFKRTCDLDLPTPKGQVIENPPGVKTMVFDCRCSLQRLR